MSDTVTRLVARDLVNPNIGVFRIGEVVEVAADLAEQYPDVFVETDQEVEVVEAPEARPGVSTDDFDLSETSSDTEAASDSGSEEE